MILSPSPRFAMNPPLVNGLAILSVLKNSPKTQKEALKEEP
jgi:hypothetical protein